jgi:antitoxin component of MazEF toxin-antitoxin module
MGRKSKVFKYHGHLAVAIPEKSAERIQIAEGSDVSFILNAENELRMKRVSEPITKAEALQKWCAAKKQALAEWKEQQDKKKT